MAKLTLRGQDQRPSLRILCYDGLLSVSRKMRAEALPIFLQINAFTATYDIELDAETVRERKFTLHPILPRDPIRGIGAVLFHDLQLELTVPVDRVSQSL